MPRPGTTSATPPLCPFVVSLPPSPFPGTPLATPYTVCPCLSSCYCIGKGRHALPLLPLCGIAARGAVHANPVPSRVCCAGNCGVPRVTPPARSPLTAHTPVHACWRRSG
jgi:hypothetical protein